MLYDDIFCEDNNVPRYDWRCRVTEVERDVSPIIDETEKYKLFFESHREELILKIKRGTITLEEMSNPLLYDANHKVRNIYQNDMLVLKEDLENLHSNLDSKAKYAFDKRNEIRNKARELMVDVKAKVFLKVVMDKDITFEEFINDKMFRKDLTREKALIDTIKSSTKSNDFFDVMFSQKKR